MTRGRSVSRKRSIRSKGNHGSILRQPCRCYLKGTRTRSPCEYWHPPECQFFIKQKRVVSQEKCVCFLITGLMNNRIKSPKRDTSQKEESPLTRMLWLKSKEYHNWVVYYKIRMHWFLKLESLGETRCRKSWYVVRVSGKTKDHRLDKYKSNFLIGEVPTLWNLRTDLKKRLQDNSDAPEARLGILLKTNTSSKKKTRLHSTFPRRNGCSRLRRQKEPEEGEFVVDSGASIHMVSKKDLNSAESEAMRTSRSPTTVMTDNGEVQTREEATVYVKHLDSIRQSYVSWRNSRSSFIGETLWGSSGFFIPPDQRSKTTSHQKWQENWLQKKNYVPFAVPGLWASSSSTTSSPTSPSSSSQDSVFDVNRYTENPVQERSGSTSGELRGHPLHETTETENKNKNGESEEVKWDISHELPDWLQEFRENVVEMKVLQQSLGETQSKEVKTLPVLLMIYQWSRERKWNRVGVSTA